MDKPTNLVQVYEGEGISQPPTVDAVEEWRIILDRTASGFMIMVTVVLMLAMGCAINWREVVAHLRYPVGVVIGMLGQFVLLPALGFGTAIAFQLQPLESIGVLVVSCSPGGSLSNFFTYWVDGDVALSIVMTTCSSLLAFGAMPLNMWIYSRYFLSGESSKIQIPYTSILVTLGLISGPVVIGMAIRHFKENLANMLTKVLSIASYVAIVAFTVIWLILYWEMFVNATPLIYVSVWLLPVTGIAVAYLVAFALRRSHQVCRTIGIETGSQNMPVALSIIVMSFSDPVVKSKILLFPTLYGITMTLEIFICIGFYHVHKFLTRKPSRELSLEVIVKGEQEISKEETKTGS